MNVDEYLRHDGVGLAERVASKEVTAREVLETAISVIDALNPTINAVISRSDERARETAETPVEGPLAGVPFLLKDVYLYDADMPTTWGSRYFKDAKPRPDSTMVQRWRRAGLPIVGKTNAPEFAAEFITEPAAYGRSVNPWDAGVTVGGSSGGAAAAVAAGMVPIAHGTDLGGSIRIPAACCGLYGFKPTAGLNPCGPYFTELAHGLNSDHVITRSVRDSAASLDITADGASGGRSYLTEHTDAPPRLRIVATVHTAEQRIADPKQVAAVEHVVAVLRDLGHAVTLVDTSPLLPIGEWCDMLWIDNIPGLLADHAKESGRDAKGDDLEPLTWASLKRMREAGEGALAKSLRMKAEVAKAYLRLFEGYDILVTPSMATDPAPVDTLGYNDIGNFEDWGRAGYGFAPFSYIANVAGQPAASLPIPMAENDIPVGVQILAAPLRDLLVLQLSRQIEEAVNWARAHERHFGAMRSRITAG